MASPNVTRREFILTSASAAVLGAGVPAVPLEAAEAEPDLIPRENRREGALDWRLTRVRVDGESGFRSRWIEGFASRQSVAAGETLDLFVSTDPPARFVVEVFRMGYYVGRGARRMAALGPFQGKAQPEPPVGPKRLRECRWEAAASLTIPADWTSGVYLGRLTTVPESPTKPYWQSYVVFVVRDSRRAAVLFQVSDNTWQAYNAWPGAFSLYTDPRGSHALGVAVSFERPYALYPQIFRNPQSLGSGEFLLWEYPLAYWLEEHGYDVTYASNSDVLDVSQLARARTFISVGHDEYWDLRQYAAVKGAIEAGVNVLWLSGNSVFATSPLSPGAGGRPHRTLERVGLFAGLTDAEVREEIGVFTEEWRRAGPDESAIIGARSIVPFNGGGDWTCTRPDHWVFAGSGMQKGDSIPGLVGWEHHGAPAAIPGLEVVAEGTSWRGGDAPARWTATVFPGPKGNVVFNAATSFWSQGLASPPGHWLPWSHWSRPHGPDARVQRITSNLLARR
jgi:hypothetical protein